VRRFSVLVALCTFALLVAGALVTSNDAALSVPDWPLSWGRLVPPLEGGIRYEFAHRVLAALVAVLTVILAFLTRSRLAWWAAAAVFAQALLGGVLVKLIDPKAIAIAHACLAQLCFALTVAVAVSLDPHGTSPSGAGKLIAPRIAVAALFLQTILGAALRHGALGLISHIGGAVLAIAAVMWASLGILMDDMEDNPLRHPATLLLILTAAELFLGMAAYTARVVTADAPQPMPFMVWCTVAHVAVGALAFGSAVALTMIATASDAARTGR
jgi:cytochrome c oxidase assembly protein subunit 15